MAARGARYLRNKDYGVPLEDRITVNSDLSGMLVIKHARKSTPDPRNPHKSVDDQFEVLDRDLARFNMRELARIDEDQQSASRYGKSLTRAKLEETMHLVRTHRVAVVALYKLNRGFRRQAIWGQFKELCEDRNTLIYVSGRLYDMSVGADSMALSFEAVVDEAAVQSAREDTLRGLRASAMAGRPHGPAKYGYQRVYNGSGQLVRVEVDEAEAKILREIADRLLVEKESGRAVARDLNSRPEATRPQDGQWNSASFKRLLLDDGYYGRRVHVVQNSGQVSFYDAIWPAIFPQEQLEIAERFFANRKRGEHSTDSRYLLTGIAFCGKCDTTMYCDITEKAYVCAKCKRTRNQVRFEEHVLHYMEAWLADDQAREAEFADDQRGEDYSGELELLERLRAELASEEAQLQSGEISSRAFTITENRLVPRIQELERTVARASAGNPWHDYVGQGRRKLADMTLAEKRTTIASFFQWYVEPLGRGKRFQPDSVRPVRVP